jgi:hypothetical protein
MRLGVCVRCILSSVTTLNEKSALFVFDCPPGPETFVIELIDDAKAAHARRILSGAEQHKIHVSGIVVRGSTPYNQVWNFHLSPDSITFFDFAVEVCDASIKYVSEHLDDVGGAFLPAGRWCPWRSHLLREIAHSRQSQPWHNSE